MCRNKSGTFFAMMRMTRTLEAMKVKRNVVKTIRARCLEGETGGERVFTCAPESYTMRVPASTGTKGGMGRLAAPGRSISRRRRVDRGGGCFRRGGGRRSDRAGFRGLFLDVGQLP